MTCRHTGGDLHTPTSHVSTLFKIYIFTESRNVFSWVKWKNVGVSIRKMMREAHWNPNGVYFFFIVWPGPLGSCVGYKIHTERNVDQGRAHMKTPHFTLEIIVAVFTLQRVLFWRIAPIWPTYYTTTSTLLEREREREFPRDVLSVFSSLAIYFGRRIINRRVKKRPDERTEVAFLSPHSSAPSAPVPPSFFLLYFSLSLSQWALAERGLSVKMFPSLFSSSSGITEARNSQLWIVPLKKLKMLCWDLFSVFLHWMASLPLKKRRFAQWKCRRSSTIGLCVCIHSVVAPAKKTYL